MKPDVTEVFDRIAADHEVAVSVLEIISTTPEGTKLILDSYMSMGISEDELVKRIKATNNFIDAIKVARKIRGWGLKEAKEYVERKVGRDYWSADEHHRRTFNSLDNFPFVEYNFLIQQNGD